MTAADDKRCDGACGVAVVDKPAGITSFGVVAKMRRIYETRRVGHTGTLDPDATGVLVVLIGRAAKAAEYVTAGVKRYDAVMRLGMTTDTEDVTGEIVTSGEAVPPSGEVIAAAESFAGEYMQTPPMYSALKRGGEKLVDLARRGITVQREPRRVEIYSIKARPTGRADEYSLSVSCSAGTYIRTLCADIGSRLGCGGCMASLRRTETCGFGIADAHTIEEIVADPSSYLLPTETLFASLPQMRVAGANEKKIKNGAAVSVDCADGRVRLYDDGGFFALGEISSGGMRAVKFFRV